MSRILQNFCKCSQDLISYLIISMQDEINLVNLPRSHSINLLLVLYARSKQYLTIYLFLLNAANLKYQYNPLLFTQFTDFDKIKVSLKFQFLRIKQQQVANYNQSTSIISIQGSISQLYLLSKQKYSHKNIAQNIDYHPYHLQWDKILFRVYIFQINIASIFSSIQHQQIARLSRQKVQKFELSFLSTFFTIKKYDNMICNNKMFESDKQTYDKICWASTQNPNNKQLQPATAKLGKSQLLNKTQISHTSLYYSEMEIKDPKYYWAQLYQIEFATYHKLKH